MSSIYIYCTSKFQSSKLKSHKSIANLNDVYQCIQLVIR